MSARLCEELHGATVLPAALGDSLSLLSQLEWEDV